MDQLRGEESLNKRHTNALLGAFASGLGNFAIVLALLLAAAPLRAAERSSAPTERGPRLALMIGADAYNRGWPDKRNAVRDAKLVASEFLRHGYKVAVLENPDSRRLNRALKQFFLIDGEDPRAQLFVWYSGHAHTIGGRTFLVPVDAPLPRREEEFTSLSFALDDYADLLRRSPAAQVYTVMDAPVAALEFDTRPDPTGMRDPFAVDLPVRQFLASAAVGQAPGDDGAFRRLFLRGLAGINRADGNLDKMLTADEIGGYIANRVAALTKNRQTPLHGRLLGREFAGGDFAFRVGPSHRTDIHSVRNDVRTGDADEVEKVLWAAIQDSADASKFEAFLKVYPDGANAEKAFQRLETVRRGQDTTVAALGSGVPTVRLPVPQPRIRPTADGPPTAPAPPAHPVSKVAQAPMAPGFEEMAVPAPGSPAAAKPGAPMALQPRNSGVTSAPSAVPASILPPGTTMRVAPRAQPSIRTPLAPKPAALGPAPTAPAAATGGRMVQLGAFRDRVSAEAAIALWRGALPSLFGAGASPNVVVADLGGKGTWYRVRLAGFADSRKANDFCAAFRGQGRDCYVVPVP